MAYIGKNLVGVLNESRTVDTMTGDNSTTTLALSRTPGSMNNVLVFIDGIRQTPDTDYTLSGSTLTFTTAPETGVSVSVISGNDTPIVPDKGSVSATKLVDGSITDSKIVGMSSSKLSGTLPALDASALTGIAKPYTVIAADPTITTNPAGGVGSLYVNSTSGEVYICTDATTDNNIWTNVGGGSGDVAPVYPGNLYSAGIGYSGELGRGTRGVQENTFGLITSMTNVKMYSSKAGHSVAILQDGTLWSWGLNDYGQLGNNEVLDSVTTPTWGRLTPVQVGTDTDWADVSTGGNCSFGLKTNGELYSWGQNQRGQLGLSDNTNRNNPTRIGSDTWKYIRGAKAPSGGGAYAIKSDDTLWGWGFGGDNAFGINPDPGTTNYPVQIGTDTDWSIVVGADESAAGIKNDGTLYTWGYNGGGQLGHGTSGMGSNIVTPTQVGSATYTDVNFCGTAMFVVKSDGTMYSAGNNGQGQLGLGYTSSIVDVLTQIGTDTDWAYVLGNASAVYAIKTNGRLYGWGVNSSGQLGLGHTAQMTSPQPIGTDTDWSVEFGDDTGGGNFTVLCRKP